MNKVSNRNCSIDIFRYVAAVLIVVIHTSLFCDLNATLGVIFVDIIARIAVPFFFAVAGFFYINKLEQGKKIFLPYVKKLIIPYSVWSAVYFIFDFIIWGHTSIKGFVVNCVRTYFIDGSHYHLWFMVALIYTVCTVTALYKLKLKNLVFPIAVILGVIGCLGSAYYEVGTKVPLLSSIYNSDYYILVRHIFLQSFPFFVLGGVVQKLKQRLVNAPTKVYVLILTFATAFWIVETALVYTLNIRSDIVISLGLIIFTAAVLLTLTRFPMPKAATASNSCRTLANFTYYAHPLAIELIEKYVGLPSILSFIIVTAVTFVLGLAIHRINNKYLNKLV